MLKSEVISWLEESKKASLDYVYKKTVDKAIEKGTLDYCPTHINTD